MIDLIRYGQVISGLASFITIIMIIVIFKNNVHAVIDYLQFRLADTHIADHQTRWFNDLLKSVFILGIALTLNTATFIITTIMKLEALLTTCGC